MSGCWSVFTFAGGGSEFTPVNAEVRGMFRDFTSPDSAQVSLLAAALGTTRVNCVQGLCHSVPLWPCVLLCTMEPGSGVLHKECE